MVQQHFNTCPIMYQTYQALFTAVNMHLESISSPVEKGNLKAILKMFYDKTQSSLTNVNQIMPKFGNNKNIFS
jgi:hypothetical protein